MMRRTGHIGRVFLGRIARFVFLTNAFLVVIGVMACAEALVLWLRWPHFANESLSRKVSIGDLAISPNGEWLVSRIIFDRTLRGCLINDVVLYGLRGQDAVRLQLGRYRPEYVAVSPGSDDLAITCLDGSIRIWSGLSDCEGSLSVGDERLRPFARTSDYLLGLAFSPDGRLLAAAGKRFIYVWRWPCGELLHKRPLDEFASPYLSFSSDSQRILSPGSRGEVCLWDAYTGETAKAISPDDGFVVNAALSPDKGLAALFVSAISSLAHNNCEVRIYGLASGEELWRYARSSAFRAVPITYSLDGRFLGATASDHGVAVIIVFDVTGGQITCELRGHEAPITGLAFAPDGLLYSGDTEGMIRSWNIEQQREQWRFCTREWGSNNRLFHEAADTPIHADCNDRHPLGHGRLP